MKGKGNQVNGLQLLEQCLWSVDLGAALDILVAKRLFFADSLSLLTSPPPNFSTQ